MSKAQELAVRIATNTPSWEFIAGYIAEAREVLNETYQFAATSPKSQQNINAVLDLFDDIEKEVGSIRAALSSSGGNES